MRTRGLLLAAVLTFIAIWAAPALLSGVSQQPTFRSQVTYVEIDVNVTDAAGAAVRGLTPADFELTEEGRVEEIAFFDEVDLGGESARPSSSQPADIPDVAASDASTRHPIYLIVLDDLSIPTASTLAVRDTARAFVERHVTPGALVAVAFTSGRTDARQDFSPNHRLALDAIARFDGRALPSAAAQRAANYQMKLGARDYEIGERFARVAGTYRTIARLADHLAPITGRRKTMIVFSEGTHMPDAVRRVGEGFEDPTRPDPSDVQQLRRALSDAATAAARANVHVYPVDPSRTGAAAQDVAVQIPLDAEARAAGVTLESFDVEQLGAQASLQQLAWLSGGHTITWANGFDAGFSRIARDSGHYYVLRYQSTRPAREGAFTRVRVTVKRPGLSVAARPGFYVPPRRGASGDDPSLGTLLNAPLAGGDLPMRMTTTRFRDTRSHAAVLVTVEFPATTFAGLGAGDTLSMLYTIVDVARGKPATAGEAISVPLPAPTLDSVTKRGFRLTLRVPLKPGRYQARVAAASGTRRGTVFADMQVPDFFGERLAWSDIALSSAAASRTPTHAGRGAAGALPVPPSAIRTFSGGDTIAAYAVLYEKGGSLQAPAQLEAVIRDGRGAVVFSHQEGRTNETARDTRGAGFRVDIPTADLAPGEYLLTFTASGGGGASQAAARPVTFVVGGPPTP